MELKVEQRYYNDCTGPQMTYVFFLNGKIVNEIKDVYEAQRFMFHLRKQLKIEVSHGSTV